MNKQEQLIHIRTRKLGVLIYDARLATRKKVEECARAMNVPVEEYQAYERGQKAPPLPALEALAYYLNIPLDHFWGHEALSQKVTTEPLKNAERLHQLRNRLIGTRLRQERTHKNLSLAELAEMTSLPEEKLKQFETGQVSIPLPELEIVSKALGLDVMELLDEHGPIGAWRMEQHAIQKFTELPSHLKEFVCQPVNRPYLELAVRLSELSVEKLRSVAESLLEITY